MVENMAWPDNKLEIKLRPQDAWLKDELGKRAFREGKSVEVVILRYLCEGLLRDQGTLARNQGSGT